MKTSFLFLAATAALLMSSCSSQLVRVKPYERGNLASPLMDPQRDSLFIAMTMHAYFSREASFGGGGLGGGGCN